MSAIESNLIDASHWERSARRWRELYRGREEEVERTRELLDRTRAGLVFVVLLLVAQTVAVFIGLLGGGAS